MYACTYLITINVVAIICEHNVVHVYTQSDVLSTSLHVAHVTLIEYTSVVLWLPVALLYFETGWALYGK